MKPKQSERVFTAVLMTAMIVLSGCSLLYPTPAVERFEQTGLDHEGLTRFDRVDGDVYRGSQPHGVRQLQALVNDHKIKTVIKLNAGSEPTVPGVGLIHYPLNAWKTPSADKVKKILDDIDGAKKPVFIHCSQGEDRTGLIVALYRVRHGMTPEAAYTDMVAHGFHPYPGVWKAWVREAGWKAGPQSTRQHYLPAS
jgi:hypothetical protein